MVNALKVKKWGAFMLACFLPTISFFMALITWGFLYAMLFFLVTAVLAAFLGTRLIKNPLLEVAEGSGLGILTIDSTGLIKLFLAKVQPPYITSNIYGKRFSAAFDRNTVNYLQPAGKVPVKTEGDKITIELPKEDYNNKVFSFSGAFPVLVYNSVLGEFYSKEMLSNLETQTFVQHLVLYLNRKVDELSNSVRDFTRYIVDQTKPKTSFFQSKWFWIVIIVVMALLMLAFAPMIMKTLGEANLPMLPSQPVNPM